MSHPQGVTSILLKSSGQEHSKSLLEDRVTLILVREQYHLNFFLSYHDGSPFSFDFVFFVTIVLHDRVWVLPVGP